MTLALTAQVVSSEREARLAGRALALGAEVGAVGDLGVGARCKTALVHVLPSALGTSTGPRTRPRTPIARAKQKAQRRSGYCPIHAI